MRIQTASIMVTAITAALALTACGGSDGDGNSSAPASTSSAPASTGASTGPSPTGNAAAEKGSSAGSESDSGSDASSGSGSGSGSTTCHADGLSGTIAAGSGAQSVDSPGVEVVELTNTGSATCTMHGFPGLDLIASNGHHWSLARKSASATTVTLAPGGKAYFGIDYMPYQSGDGMEFKASSILITPPNDTHQLSVKWGEQSVLDQSAASHPATFVEPVVKTNPALG